MTTGSAVIDATLLWPHACKSSVVSVALGTGLATILGFACGFGSVVSPSEIDACASSALRGFADSLPDDGRGFAGTAGDDAVQCNKDFESIGLPSYQHFRPSISR